MDSPQTRRSMFRQCIRRRIRRARARHRGAHRAAALRASARRAARGRVPRGLHPLRRLQQGLPGRGDPHRAGVGWARGRHADAGALPDSLHRLHRHALRCRLPHRRAHCPRRWLGIRTTRLDRVPPRALHYFRGAGMRGRACGPVRLARPRSRSTTRGDRCCAPRGASAAATACASASRHRRRSPFIALER